MEKIRKYRRGSSLISVIVAFAILMIAISMLYTAMVTSQNLMVRARKMDEEAASVLEDFYSSYQSNTASAADNSITLKPKSGGGKSFTVNGTSTEGAETDGIYYYQSPSAAASGEE